MTISSRDDRVALRPCKLILWFGLFLVVGGLLVSFTAAYQAMPTLLRIGVGACVVGSAVILGGLGLIAVLVARHREDAERRRKEAE